MPPRLVGSWANSEEKGTGNNPCIGWRNGISWANCSVLGVACVASRPHVGSATPSVKRILSAPVWRRSSTMGTTPDTPAGSLTRSLPAPVPTSLPPLVPGVPAPSSTQIEMPSFENSEQAILAMMLILQGFAREVYNPDTVGLALLGAKKRAAQLGLDPTVFDEVIERFEVFCEQSRSRNPLSRLF